MPLDDTAAARGGAPWTRLTLALWAALALGVALLAPTPPPPGPVAAELRFGEAPSMNSSAPAGTLALAAVLERFGYEVVAHGRWEPPEADVWLLLEPGDAFEREEVTAVLGWVDRGGRLVYAPSPGLADDPLLDALARRLPPPCGPEHGVRAGCRWALLPEGAAPLTNAGLRDGGLAPALAWLRPLLEGAQRVAFDELRIGAAPPEDVRERLLRSRFGPGVGALVAATLLYLWAVTPRRRPMQPEPPARGRAFGEHLDAVARALARGRREALARRAMAEGTRRRLGPLADAEAARRLLEAAEAGGPPGALRRHAEALRALEAGEGARRTDDA